MNSLPLRSLVDLLVGEAIGRLTLVGDSTDEPRTMLVPGSPKPSLQNMAPAV
jgi:hypothetical protein